MRAKSAIFLSVLLIAGCGVMNNPSTDKGASDGDNIFKASEIVLEVSKIDSNNLIVTNENIADLSIFELSSYKIFETSNLTETFLSDLNSSAQTLASADLAIVESWITGIKTANINYERSNFLFYPILQNKNCGRKDSVIVDDKNVTIKIEAITKQCDTAFIYHLLMYKVDKGIENISIKVFDEGTVLIPNSAK